MKKILIVDDEQDIRELLKKRLEQNKYSAITASGGEEALNISKAERPDLVLLDIAMPGLDGYQTCERLRKERVTKDIPVLFLTAKDLKPEGILGRYADLGNCAYLPKPAKFSELLAKIKEIIG